MHNQRLVAIAFALLLVAARAEAQFTPREELVPAEDFHVELGTAFWTPQPALSLTTGDARVGTVDFVREFGIGKERFRELRIVLKPGRKHKLRFSRVPLKYNEDAVLERTITFQNLTFPTTANANANINWDLYRFGYQWDVVSMPRGFVGLVTELKYNRIKASVSATSQVLGQNQTLSANIDQKAPVPTIGGAARGYIGKHVSITGEFTALKIDREQFAGKFYDFDVYGAAHLGKYVGVQVGYRSIDADYTVDSDQGTMKMKGPYFGGFLRF